MNEFFSNRYVQLGLLTLGIAVFFYLVIMIVFALVGFKDFPQFLQVTLSVLGAGLLVYKFFADRIA